MTRTKYAPRHSKVGTSSSRKMIDLVSEIRVAKIFIRSFEVKQFLFLLQWLEIREKLKLGREEADLSRSERYLKSSFDETNESSAAPKASKFLSALFVWMFSSFCVRSVELVIPRPPHSMFSSRNGSKRDKSAAAVMWADSKVDRLEQDQWKNVNGFESRSRSWMTERMRQPVEFDQHQSGWARLFRFDWKRDPPCCGWFWGIWSLDLSASRWVSCPWSSPIVFRTRPTLGTRYTRMRRSWNGPATASRSWSRRPRTCSKLPKVRRSDPFLAILLLYVLNVLHTCL